MAEIRPSKKHLTLFWLLVLAAPILLFEVGARILFKTPFVPPLDERNMMYQYDAELGWMPRPNSESTMSGHRKYHVVHNAKGFRDREHTDTTKPRMIFLGDSLLWGFDAELSERFTEKLQTKIPDWELYNLGVSGFGTDQEYLLLKRVFKELQPKVVWVVYSTLSDSDDNRRNWVYGGYYKPYFTKENGKLILHGNSPTPKSPNYIYAHLPNLRRSRLAVLLISGLSALLQPAQVFGEDTSGPLLSEMRDFVRSQGARMIVLLSSQQPELEKYLSEEKIEFMAIRNAAHYPDSGFHWTPEAHSVVANSLLDYWRKIVVPTGIAQGGSPS